MGVDFDAHDAQQVLGNTWPAFVSIKLPSLYVDADALLKFFERHKDTLTILCLRHIGLSQTRRILGWMLRSVVDNCFT